MQPDLWQQWQALASQFANPASPAYRPLSTALFIDSSERFSAEARKFLDGVANASSAASDAMLQFSDFLRERFADVQPLWAAGFGVGALGAGPGSPAASAMNSPALGATREHQERAERMLEAGRRALDAQRRLQRLWADSLREAATAFTTRLATAEQCALETEALRKLYDRWIDCAEEAYARTAHSEVFCSALTDFVNASSQWRREFRRASSIGRNCTTFRLAVRSTP